MTIPGVPDWLAPCGRDCVQCPDYEGFPQGFAQTAQRLLQLLVEFPFSLDVARQHGGFDIDQFKSGLHWFAGQSNLCRGCAPGPCLSSSKLLPGCDSGCPIRACAREKSIALCAFCELFPCEHSAYSQRGMANLIEIRQIGLEKWLSERSERDGIGGSI